MSDENIANAVAAGVARALENADPATRLAHAKSQMTDSIRNEIDGKRRARETSIMQRVFRGRTPGGPPPLPAGHGPQIGDSIDDRRIVQIKAGTAYLNDGTTRTVANLKRLN
jgi:hypothetical protein